MRKTIQHFALLFAITLFTVACGGDSKSLITKKWKIKDVKIEYSEKAKEKMKALNQDMEKATVTTTDAIKTLEYFEFKADGTFQSAKDKGQWSISEDGKKLNMKRTEEGDQKGLDVNIDVLTSTELTMTDKNGEDEYGTLTLVLEKF